MSSLLGGLAHPFLCVDAFAKGYLQVLDKLFHARLVSWWEVLLHVELTYSFTEDTVDHAHAALPARTGLLCSGHDASVEVEELFIHFVTQHGTCCIEHLPLHPVLEHGHRCVSQHGESLFYGFRLSYREGVDVGDALHVKVGLPVKTGIFLDKVRE